MKKVTGIVAIGNSAGIRKEQVEEFARSLFDQNGLQRMSLSPVPGLSASGGGSAGGTEAGSQYSTGGVNKGSKERPITARSTIRVRKTESGKRVVERVKSYRRAHKTPKDKRGRI